MRAYTIVIIPLMVIENFVIFDEFYLRCPATGNCLHSKTEKTFVSNYVEQGDELVSSGDLKEFKTYSDALTFVEEASK
jgi:hypothetical protein